MCGRERRRERGGCVRQVEERWEERSSSHSLLKSLWDEAVVGGPQRGECLREPVLHRTTGGRVNPLYTTVARRKMV